MELIPQIKDNVQKPELEQVEKQKVEYNLLGRYLLTPGLTLFGYNHLDNVIFKVVITYSDTVEVYRCCEGLKWRDADHKKTTIDSRFQYFEALNMKNAKKRVKNYKLGKVRDLSNLRKYNPEAKIKFY